MTAWSGVAESYRLSFAGLCAGTIERLLADTCGPQHLDVGCGTGDLAREAADVGRFVIASDADLDMVAVTRSVHSAVIHAALPRLPFSSNQFDAVTANFVVNHVADPRAAMWELARVVRPGGRVAATIWPARKTAWRKTAWGELVQDAFTAAGVVPTASQRLSPEVDFERSVAGLVALFEEAGLNPVLTDNLEWDWEISVDDLWRGVAGGVATVGRTFMAQTPTVQVAAEHEFRKRARSVCDGRMLRVANEAAYVVGSK